MNNVESSIGMLCKESMNGQNAVNAMGAENEMTPTKDDALAAAVKKAKIALECQKNVGRYTEQWYVASHLIALMQDGHLQTLINSAEQALTQPRETVSTTRDYVLIAPVAHYFNGDAEKTRLWFETPNPNLGGVKPIDTPRDRLLKFITEQTLTQPTVDVEALKRECTDKLVGGTSNDYSIASTSRLLCLKIEGTIDHLVSKGYLK